MLKVALALVSGGETVVMSVDWSLTLELAGGGGGGLRTCRLGGLAGAVNHRNLIYATKDGIII